MKELWTQPAGSALTQLSTVLVGRDDAEVRELVDRLRPPRVSAERFAQQVNAGTVEQHARRVDDLVGAGVDTVIVSLADLDDPAPVERFADVIAHFRASVSGGSRQT